MLTSPIRSTGSTDHQKVWFVEESVYKHAMQRGEQTNQFRLPTQRPLPEFTPPPHFFAFCSGSREPRFFTSVEEFSMKTISANSGPSARGYFAANQSIIEGQQHHDGVDSPGLANISFFGRTELEWIAPAAGEDWGGCARVQLHARLPSWHQEHTSDKGRNK